jgi:hypothetical protein
LSFAILEIIIRVQEIVDASLLRRREEIAFTGQIALMMRCLHWG